MPFRDILLWCPVHGSQPGSFKGFASKRLWPMRREGMSVVMVCGCCRHVLPGDLDYSMIKKRYPQ